MIDNAATELAKRGKSQPGLFFFVFCFFFDEDDGAEGSGSSKEEESGIGLDPAICQESVHHDAKPE